MSEPPLGQVVAAAGAALSDAQRELLGEGFAAQMAVSEVELEVKAAFGRDGRGELTMTPISAADLAKGTIAPGLVSTVKVRYTAVAADEAPTAEAPAKSSPQVIDQVRAREDVARLDRILGGLDLQATFVPEVRRWLVSARDPEGRVVRQLVVEDRPGS
jgi:hypothetical protein